MIKNNIELRDAIRELNPSVEVRNLSPEICGNGVYNTIYTSVPLYTLNIPKGFTRCFNEIKNKETGMTLEVLLITDDIKNLLMPDFDVAKRQRII